MAKQAGKRKKEDDKGVYVTPHMVANSFQERGLPIWDFFCLRARSGTGTPRMVMGIGVFAFP